MRKITLEQVAKLLRKNDNFEILTHRYPDGDTLGCGYALCYALQQLGKKAKVILSGSLPSKFEYMTKNIIKQDFTPEYILSVDVAALSLLGENQEKYSGKIKLCIDHHISNSMEADNVFVDAKAAAACEIIYKIIKLLDVKISRDIANCIYTGISTDTGCFRYANTSAQSHQITAELMSIGCDWEIINRSMFETKSREKLALERMVYKTLEFFAEGKGALIYTTLDMQKKACVDDDEMEGLASIPRQIEGVSMGITIREKENSTYKISVRTTPGVDASAFCKKFGGGGHPAASGCSIEGNLETVKKALVEAAESFL